MHSHLSAFQVLNIDAVICTGVIVFRWVAQVGSNEDEVKGINVLYASNDPKVGGGYGKGVDGWVLETVYSEFKSAAWVVDLGGTCGPPASPGAKL